MDKKERFVKHTTNIVDKFIGLFIKEEINEEKLSGMEEIQKALAITAIGMVEGLEDFCGKVAERLIENGEPWETLLKDIEEFAGKFYDENPEFFKHEPETETDEIPVFLVLGKPYGPIQ